MPIRIKRKKRPAVKIVRRKPKIMKMNSNIHHFKRGCELVTYTGSSAPVLVSWSFGLASCINFGEFTALFDQYRINAIQLHFHYRYDPGASGTFNNTASYPRLYTVKDYDDVVTPLSITELREYDKCKLTILNPNRPFKLMLRPAIRSTVGSNHTPKWKQWLDCDLSSTSHYGIKWGVDNLPTNAILEVEIKYFLSFKDVK